MLIVYFMLTFLMVFLGVVFVTLIERKILGGIQFRLGPNKIFFKGSIQSVSDAVKLMSKSGMSFFFSSGFEYNFLPVGMLLLMMFLWSMMPSSLGDYFNTLLMVLCILSVGVYPIMYGSWFSGSLYSMIGSIRAIAQMISYEVSMIIIIMSLVVFPKTFNLNMFFLLGYGGVFLFFLVLLFMLFISLLLELGRTPADLLEGESELVSGFNTEYFGLKFAFIFLSEYGMIMFMAGLLSSVGVGVTFFSMSWIFFSMLFILLIIWIRGMMPRIRYDKMMFLCWVSMLNLSLGILIINISVIVIM